jgi:hypothetical protein
MQVGVDSLSEFKRGVESLISVLSESVFSNSEF